VSNLKTIQFSLARALEDGGGSDEEAEMYVSEITACAEERIINLIKPFTVCDDDCDHYGCTTFVAEQVIALIKGENK